MKRYILLMLVASFLLFIVVAAEAIDSGTRNNAAVKQACVLKETKNVISSLLPASLTVIEEDAFAGTSLESVYLPDSVIIIGDCAFADIGELNTVRLSDNIQLIDGNPFAGSENVILSGSAIGYGRKWASENGIHYEVEIRINRKAEARQHIAICSWKITEVIGKEQKDERVPLSDKSSHKGRTEGELNAAVYHGGVAMFVRSRYFP